MLHCPTTLIVSLQFRLNYRLHSDLKLVPVFDGRDGFDLNNLADHDETYSELEPGSAVLIIFSAHTYSPYKSQITKNRIGKDDPIVSLNLRAAVLLNDSDPEFDERQKPDAVDDALGVTFPAEQKSSQDDDADSESLPDTDPSLSLFTKSVKASNTDVKPPIRF